jgi:hypothetical protein
MTIKEIKKMIAEEYRYWMAEQPSDMDMPDLPAVKVGAGDVDPGGEDAEATLKDIFDMLKDYFEGGGDEPVADVEDDEGDAGDEGDEGDEEEKEETNESKKRKMRKIVREALKLKRGKKRLKSKPTKRKLLESKKRPNRKSGILVERFKKLANIVK